MNNGQAAQRTTEILNPVIQATRETFELMLNCAIEKVGVSLLEATDEQDDILATIALTGETNGSICLQFPRQTAFGVVERLVQIEPEEVDDLVCDCIGELANVIGGGTKSKLQQFALTLGLPQIVRTRSLRNCFAHEAQPLCLSYNSGLGPFHIAFAFDSEVEANSAVSRAV